MDEFKRDVLEESLMLSNQLNLIVKITKVPIIMNIRVDGGVLHLDKRSKRRTGGGSGRER